METKNKKRLLIGVTAYVAVVLLILLITNLGHFNAWLDRLMFLLRPVLIGVVLAYLLNPFFRLFERKLFYKIQPNALRRGISLTFTYLTLLLIFVVLLLLIIPQLVDSILNFLDKATTHIDNTIHAVNNLIYKFNDLLPEAENGSGMITPLDPEAVKVSFAEWMNSIKLDGKILMQFFNPDTIGTIVNMASSLVSLITDTIFGLFISLYLLNTKERRYAQVMRLRKAMFSDHTNEIISKICATADRSFGGFLKGKILDSAIIGVLVYIAISILGVPYALLIAVIVAITDIVPIIGPFIGVIPSAIIILLTDPTKVIPFLLCILVVQQIDGNIIAPKILGENTGVSSLCVMIAITTMGTLWGLAGMVLGVPLFATVLELTSEYLDKRLKQKGLPTDTESYASPELTMAAESGGTVFEQIRKKKSHRRAAATVGGEGNLTASERVHLDTYELAKKHRLFSENSEEILELFAVENAALAASVEEGLMTAEALDLQDEERVENESTESEDSAAPMTEEI